MTVEKVALITAGGSGMGAAAARKLAQDDPRVVANVIKAWIGNND